MMGAERRLRCSRATFVVALCWLAGCAPSMPVLDAVHPELDAHDLDEAATADLLAARRECGAVEPGSLGVMVRCQDVEDALRKRRAAAVHRLYEQPVEAIERSCAAAKHAGAALPSLFGSVDADDGTALPPWRDLGPSREVPIAVDPGALVAHARALLVCGDGAGLSAVIDAYRQTLEAGVWPDDPMLPLDDMVRSLVTLHPRSAWSLGDTSTAPAAMARVLDERGDAARPTACPATAPDVFALMRSTSPTDRADGCACVSALPPAERHEALALRDEIAASDPHRVAAPTGGDPIGCPPILCAVLTLPMVAAELGRSSAGAYPVRAACTEAARFAME